MPKHIYDYEQYSFTLTIPEYWSTIYKGQPRKQLYHDYIVMLDWVKRVGKNKIILDVGANHGLFAVPSSLLGYTVIGFEPVKSNYDNLVESKHENNLIGLDIFNIALSNENGVKDIYVPECFDNASLNADAAVSNMINKDFEVQKVFTVRFDDWVKNYPQYNDIGLIKIDAQGSEYSILEGMKGYLPHISNVYLICEYEHHLNTMGHSFNELDNLIFSYGFKHLFTNGNDKYFYKQ